MAKNRVLIVDDQSFFRNLITTTLNEHGFKTFTAKNGAEALELIQTQIIPINLMIVDYRMPVMNGLNFITFAKKIFQTQDASTIFLTDTADAEVVKQAIRIGVDNYILKSNISIQVLIDKINHCLTQSK